MATHTGGSIVGEATHQHMSLSLQCGVEVRTIKKMEDKQQQNITIPTKFFCRVQKNMQETWPQRRRERSEKKWRREREREESG